jgi:hypothetical protein
MPLAMSLSIRIVRFLKIPNPKRQSPPRVLEDPFLNGGYSQVP